jgi:hypothetical protein
MLDPAAVNQRAKSSDGKQASPWVTALQCLLSTTELGGWRPTKAHKPYKHSHPAWNVPNR